MALKKKRVDDTPICDRAYLRRIDPVWMPGRVPNGFWNDVAHRRDYLLWLSGRLGFRHMADFYRLVVDRMCRRNYGGGVVKRWDASALSAVEDCFPEYDWKPWLFPQVSPGFWDSPANRRSYLEWLGKELGFRRPEDWYRIRKDDISSRHGTSLLHRFSSLYDIMREFMPELDWDMVDRYRPITSEDILAWADAHHAAHGAWPTYDSGEIPGAGLTWAELNRCLKEGFRGLPGGNTLLRFLKEHRDGPIGRIPPPLSEEQILAWADAYFAAQGTWPTRASGPIPGTRESWKAIAGVMRTGCRGFPKGSSFAQLLARQRGARNPKALPRLTWKQILAWADAYFAAEGKWPTNASGPIPGTNENWFTVAKNMEAGNRGLGRCSLPQLLAKRRGVRNPKALPPFTEERILKWARTHHKVTGAWPRRYSGPIAQSPGETWATVYAALHGGHRGLPGGSSLARLLRKHGLGAQVVSR